MHVSTHLARRLAGHALLVFLLMLHALPASAQARGRQPAQRTLDDVVHGVLEEQFIPGAVVAVVHADSLVLLRAYGRTALPQDAPALEEAALFRAAAVTEVLNALTATTLAAADVVALDRALGTRVDGVPPELRAVTLEQLVSHTAGMSHQIAVPGRGGADDLGAAARGLTRFDRVTDPGLLYSYSRPGLSLSGLVLQSAAGRPYAAVVRQRVLEPLGMRASTLSLAEAQARLTPGWRSTNMPGERLAAVQPLQDSAVYAPVRGLHATADDLARLSIALLNDGVVQGERLLPEGAAARLWHVHAAVPASAVQAAKGMRIGTWRERPAVTIVGGHVGHAVMLRLLPAERLGVVVLANNQSAWLGDVTDFVLSSLLRLGDAGPRTAEPGVPPADDALDVLLRHAGPYENGSELLEIVDVDGRPMLRSDELLLEVRPLEDGGYGALLDGRVGLRFRLIEDEHGRSYLWLGNRALSPESVRRPARR